MTKDALKKLIMTIKQHQIIQKSPTHLAHFVENPPKLSLPLCHTNIIYILLCSTVSNCTKLLFLKVGSLNGLSINLCFLGKGSDCCS